MTETPSRWRTLTNTDPDIDRAIADERHRQNSGLELIASENFVSQAVLQAAGSVLTNKYAEGYPGKRYYGGCEFVDVVEGAGDRARQGLFGAEHANVQPHSGAQANMAVYFTLLKPGDTVLGMNLAHGGHLTHGHPLNFSGKLYTIVPYGVRQRRRAHRLRRARAARARAQAEDDHGRRQRLSADHRFRAHRRGRPAPSARRSSPTWRTSPDWSPPASIRARCRTPTSSPPRRTRRCADRAAAWSSAARSTPKTSIGRSSPASRAAR